MGTSCISGLSARHGFEQVVFIGWLSNKHFIRVCPTKYFKVCLMKKKHRRVVHSTIGVYSNEIYRRVVHSTIGVCPNEIYRRVVHSTIGVCPNEIDRRVVHDTIGVCPNKIYRRVVYSIIGICPNEKKKGISEGGPTFYWSLSNEPLRELKQKPFGLEKKIHTWQKCMCEGVCVNSRDGAWHVAFM